MFACRVTRPGERSDFVRKGFVFFSPFFFFFSSEAKLQSDITDTWHSSYLDNRGRASLLRLHFPKARKIKARVEKRSLWDGFFK